MPLRLLLMMTVILVAACGSTKDSVTPTNDQTPARAAATRAWELVDEGLLTEEDFRDFTFVNAATMWKEANPAFFEGTVVVVATVERRVVAVGTEVGFGADACHCVKEGPPTRAIA